MALRHEVSRSHVGLSDGVKVDIGKVKVGATAVPATASFAIPMNRRETG
jgi:hypothetical protein